MSQRSTASPPSLEQLSDEAGEQIGGLRTRVIREARVAIPYDFIVPSGMYEELWDWDAFFVGFWH
jgi:hypothetical protein